MRQVVTVVFERMVAEDERHRGKVMKVVSFCLWVTLMSMIIHLMIVRHSPMNLGYLIIRIPLESILTSLLLIMANQKVNISQFCHPKKWTPFSVFISNIFKILC